MDKTLLKGLALLEALARSPQPRGVTDLAREQGIGRSNAHRTLQTLAAAGFVKQDETSAYSCTLKLFELGRAVFDRIDVANVAEPVIRALAEKTQETVHLSVLDGFDVVYVRKIDSPQPVRAYSSIGSRSPACCVATGKALLAHQEPGYCSRFADRLVAHTPQSIVSLEALEEELAEVRRQGHAINRGEWRESVCGLASPIFGAGGAVVAAIGISGPVERLRPALLRRFAPDVQAAARDISQSLGHIMSRSA
ncbi:MAG TPA: IclR family transcriptional regulator [Saliniramus sp.]|nr:IclR family transcriptional regulator [Saliniramus sp.]